MADQGKVLCNVGWRGGVVLGGQEHEASSCYLALVKAVHPRQKGGDAERLFKRVRPGGLLKRVFEIPLQILGDRHFSRDVPPL